VTGVAALLITAAWWAAIVYAVVVLHRRATRQQRWHVTTSTRGGYVVVSVRRGSELMEMRAIDVHDADFGWSVANAVADAEVRCHVLNATANSLERRNGQ
jgi:hypothetical protein